MLRHVFSEDVVGCFVLKRCYLECWSVFILIFFEAKWTLGDATGFNLALPTGECAYDLKFIVFSAYKCLVVEFLEGALQGKG